jgi:hypothetical protein
MTEAKIVGDNAEKAPRDPVSLPMTKPWTHVFDIQSEEWRAAWVAE